MKKYIILLAVVAFSSSSAFAAKAYGPAGCGLGNLIFKKDNQILAATTNGSSDSQMFGITSGTSNCTDDGAVASAKQVPLFIEANRMALANDVARGSGETVANLSQVMGCSNAAVLASVLQRNYRSIFTSEKAESTEISGNIMAIVKKDDKVMCRNVI
jgi:hypothetical protein